MKGLGKGMVGAVVKPTAGVLDLASDISSGIKATATQAGAHKALRARPPRAPVYDPKAPLTTYDIHKALASDMVIKHSLHKTFANQMKEKLMDYVKIESGAKFFLLTDQRVMIIDVDAGIGATPQSIPLHRASDCPLAAVANRTAAAGACRSDVLSLVLACCVCLFAEVKSSSKGPSGTIIDIVYETDDKKSHKLAIVRNTCQPTACVHACSRCIAARGRCGPLKRGFGLLPRAQEMKGVMGAELGADADKKKTDELAMTLLINSIDAQQKHMQRGR
jgi:hypothetical protein